MVQQRHTHPELAVYFDNMDSIDTKSAYSEKSLRETVSGMFSYCPGWLRFLYRIRGVIARMLNLKHDIDVSTGEQQPEDISMTPGGKARFFDVVSARENVWWVAYINDSHLKAWVIAVREPQQGTKACYHVTTSVRYNDWKGPLYFNLIKPFHHLVVAAMLHHAAKSTHCG